MIPHGFDNLKKKSNKQGLSPYAITLKKVNIYFGSGNHRLHVVKNINLKLKRGECFGLVGESGSGKTSLLKMIIGLIDHWEGEVSVNNQEQRKKKSIAFYKKIQMVFQDPYASLNPRQTINQILMQPINIHRLKNGAELIIQTLEQVGLPPHIRFRFPHELSGGQRQRIAIARAIILRPNILLLDEPTSSLDVSVQAEVLNLLTELKEQFGLTYLFVSHNLSVIAHMCNRIGVMRHGSLLETLSVGALRRKRITHPYTRKLFKASLLDLGK